MRTLLALFVSFSACGGSVAVPSAAVQQELPKTSTPKLVLELPAELKAVRAKLHDPEQKLSARCDSAETCATLSSWLTTQGTYTLELEYVGADGVRERKTQTFAAGFGELSVSLHAMVDQDGVIEAMLPRITGAPVQGVSVQVTTREPVTAVSELVLVNGSKDPIFVPSQDSHVLASITGVNGTIDPPRYGGCGTGIGLHELAAGASIQLGEVYAIGGRPAIPRGRYRISVQYGVDPGQEAMSVGGSRAAELELDFDGPAPAQAPPRQRKTGEPTFTPRDPGRPALTFAPARTEGAEVPATAPKLAFDQSVAGTLTAKSPRRYFRVEPPSSMEFGAVRFYARCAAPGCKQSAYAVLTDAPDSVSDARGLRGSGGWTQLTDDARLGSEKPWFLVIACLDGCAGPISFFGAVTQGDHGW
jgi:hypothetical protein